MTLFNEAASGLGVEGTRPQQRAISMVNRNKDLAECGLHFLLAATYLAHEPTPQTIVAVLAYLGLAALSLAEHEKEKTNEQEPGATESPFPVLPRAENLLLSIERVAGTGKMEPADHSGRRDLERG